MAVGSPHRSNPDIHVPDDGVAEKVPEQKDRDLRIPAVAEEVESH